MGFVRGFLAPFRGGLYVSRQGFVRYLVLPAALNVALTIAAMALVGPFVKEELQMHLGNTPLTGLWWIALVLLTIVGGLVAFIVVQPILSAVFCDHLSEAVEKRTRGSAPAVPFFTSTGRALLHGVLKLALYLVALLVGLVLTIFTAGVGGVVGVGLAALFLAYDGFDYPLGRRGVSFGGKWGYLATHPGLTVGYGLGATLLYLVPLAMFVAPAFCAAGATLVYLDAEAKAEARKKPPADPKTASVPAKNPADKPDDKADKPPENQHNPIDISAT